MAQTVRQDRFGNQTILKTLVKEVNRKTGEEVASYKGYIEIGSQLFKVQVSKRNKEHKTGRDALWCKVTKLKKRGDSGGITF